MRGLTAEEYEVLQWASAPPDPDGDGYMTADEDRICRRLAGQGRLRDAVIDGDEWYVVTPAGREAMRIHEALSALEGVT